MACFFGHFEMVLMIIGNVYILGTFGSKRHYKPVNNYLPAKHVHYPTDGTGRDIYIKYTIQLTTIITKQLHLCLEILLIC